MCEFKVCGESLTFLFKGNRRRSFYFSVLNGAEKTSDGTLYFDVAMEKDIVYTLWYFDSMREFSDIRASYKIHDGKIHLRIVKEDLDYMITSVALNTKNLFVLSKKNRRVHIETEIPFLLHGLVFGSNETFAVCYSAFTKMFKIGYFRKFCGKKTNLQALQNVFNYTAIKKNFHDMLLFLGRCLKLKKLTLENFRYNENNTLVRAIRSYCYVINKSLDHKLGVGIPCDTEILLSGSSLYNYIYTIADVKMKNLKDEKKCALKKVLRIYKLCFTNLDVEAFENTYVVLWKEKKRHELKIRSVENSFNFSNPLPNQLSSNSTTQSKDVVFIQLQYQKIERHYRELLYDSRPVSDTKTETLMLKPLLLILDALKFTDSKNCSMYVHKTRLFDMLLQLIERQKYKTIPLLVPTVPRSEDVNGIASTDLYDYFSTVNWVFPIFLAEKEYDMSKVQKKIKTNKHKLS